MMETSMKVYDFILYHLSSFILIIMYELRHVCSCSICMFPLVMVIYSLFFIAICMLPFKRSQAMANLAEKIIMDMLVLKGWKAHKRQLSHCALLIHQKCIYIHIIIFK